MVKIRLSRGGRKHLPHYRIVVMNAREKRESRAIESIGNYSPLTKLIEIDVERAKYWLSVGAQPTDTVRNLLVKKNLLEADKKKKVFAKKPGKQNVERKAAVEEAA
jgi:small subunit ribosomal protein S16